MHKASFILSTGRCGTQWLHQFFGNHYSNFLFTDHEPLGYEQYQELQKISTYSAEKDSLLPAVRRHVDTIVRTLNSSDYLETGSPCWSALLKLHEWLPGGIQVIWITRHPIDLIESLLSHGLYREPLLPHQSVREPVTPFMKSASYPDYQSNWSKMSRQEKLLYFWLEVNTMGQCLEKYNIPVLRLGFESLFEAESVKKIANFLQVGLAEDSLPFTECKVDNYNYGKFEHVDNNLLVKHPEAISMMTRLGYKMKAHA